MRRVVLAVALLVGLGSAIGCGRDVARPAAPPTPYVGPLHLEPKDARNDIERKTGAAGRVASCTTRVTGAVDPEDSEPGSTPERALAAWLDLFGSELPTEGYLLERQEDDRVLFTFRLDGRVLAAVIVAKGAVRGSTGWTAESWASCNASEFPAESVEHANVQIWTDTDGRRVPTYEVVSSFGPEHCDWDETTFLTLDGDHDRQYLGRVTEGLRDYVVEPYQEAVRRPADAVDTGYRREGRDLWLSADRTKAYVGTPGAVTVELWPQLAERVACA